jgi:hypothetical protein
LRLTKGWFRKKKKEEARRGQANGEAAAVWVTGSGLAILNSRGFRHSFDLGGGLDLDMDSTAATASKGEALPSVSPCADLNATGEEESPGTGTVQY